MYRTGRARTGRHVPDLILSLVCKFQSEIADAVSNGCKLLQRHRKIKKPIEIHTPFRYTQAQFK